MGSEMCIRDRLNFGFVPKKNGEVVLLESAGRWSLKIKKKKTSLDIELFLMHIQQGQKHAFLYSHFQLWFLFHVRRPIVDILFTFSSQHNFLAS